MPPAIPNDSGKSFWQKAQSGTITAGWNQKELAAVLGLAPRTISRWFKGSHVLMIPAFFQRLAVALHPFDAGFAAEMAARGGTTLEALGVVAPAKPAPAPAPAPVPAPAVARAAPVRAVPAATGPLATLASALLGNVAVQLDLPPSQFRHILAAGFAQARALGLSTEDLAKAFESSQG